MNESDINQKKCPSTCTMVVFGASGDLTKRLLLPSLRNLARDGLLPEKFSLVGYGREQLTDDEFKGRIKDALSGGSPKAAQKVVDSAHYLAGQYDQLADYEKLKGVIDDLSQKDGSNGSCLFYLAVPPIVFLIIAGNLGKAGLLKEENGRWRRLVIEKPFGSDLESSRALDAGLKHFLPESQIFRIDHYLGKETVQNVMALRFGNGIVEPIWNSHYIDNVQITVAEEVGVEKRAAFYEAAGALRDMVPNHLMQLLSMLAMEPPANFSADAIHNEKSKLLSSVEPIPEDEVSRLAVRGQYTTGAIREKLVSGYRSEPNVAPNSLIETYVAMKLSINNWRWAGVPFYLRTGKRLKQRTTVIVVEFKRAPHMIFPSPPGGNLMTIFVQPCEGVAIQLGAKIPGPEMRLGNVELAFSYADYFGREPSTGYETLIYDVMVGDRMLFQRADTVDLGWQVVEPLLTAWKRNQRASLTYYPAGTWGPVEAEALLLRDGRGWHIPTELISRAGGKGCGA